MSRLTGAALLTFVLLGTSDVSGARTNRAEPYSPVGSNAEIFAMNADGSGRVHLVVGRR